MEITKVYSVIYVPGSRSPDSYLIYFVWMTKYIGRITPPFLQRSPQSRTFAETGRVYHLQGRAGGDPCLKRENRRKIAKKGLFGKAVAVSGFVWHTLVMRNPLRPIFRWLHRPAVGQSPITIREALNSPYKPNTVGILLERMERDTKEHLNWADRLDRKLLAVITADGVYFAILPSIRDSLPTYSLRWWGRSSPSASFWPT